MIVICLNQKLEILARISVCRYFCRCSTRFAVETSWIDTLTYRRDELNSTDSNLAVWFSPPFIIKYKRLYIKWRLHFHPHYFAPLPLYLLPLQCLLLWQSNLHFHDDSQSLFSKSFGCWVSYWILALRCSHAMTAMKNYMFLQRLEQPSKFVALMVFPLHVLLLYDLLRSSQLHTNKHIPNEDMSLYGRLMSDDVTVLAMLSSFM